MRQELPLHDAAFNGVILQDRAAELHFMRIDGGRYVVHLAGIDVMQMDDFREGNIVVIFETISGEPPPTSVAWDRLYPPPHPAADREYHLKHDDFVRGKVSKIGEGQLTLVQMVPAIGADLAVVCESIRTIEG